MTHRPYRLHTALLAVLFALLTGMAAPRLCAENSAATDILPQQVQAQYARLARLDNPALLARIMARSLWLSPAAMVSKPQD